MYLKKTSKKCINNNIFKKIFISVLHYISVYIALFQYLRWKKND